MNHLNETENPFFSSQILKSQDQINQIQKMLISSFPWSFTIKQIFSTSIDGWNRKYFLKKSKAHNETLILIETDLETTIGGYTCEPWTDTGLNWK